MVYKVQVLRNSSFGQITKRRSKDLQNAIREFETTENYQIWIGGPSKARHLLNDLHTDSKAKERKRTGDEDTARRHPGTEVAVVGPAACRP